MFFSEIMKEASEIAGCLNSKATHLVLLHCATAMQICLVTFFQRFKNDQQALVLQGLMLMEYLIMNAIALRRILRKYDKVHNSVSGKNFVSKLRAEHVDIVSSTWLIELVAFYMNSSESNQKTCDENTLFHPYALVCGHIFCKSCACSATSLLLYEGLKSASPNMKFPVCREAGVYGNAVRMTELDLLIKRRFKEQWKERLVEEQAEVAKQVKEQLSYNQCLLQEFTDFCKR